MTTAAGFEIIGPKLQIDQQTLSEQGKPLLEDPQPTLQGKLQSNKRFKLQRGSRLAALIDNECVERKNSQGLGASIVTNSGEQSATSVQAYAFELDTEQSLESLDEHAASDECILQIGNDFDVSTIAVPNDPSYSAQWFHTAMQSSAGWDIFYNTNGVQNDVVIAIVDTGVDYNHADLKANMWTNSQGEHGFDFSNNDRSPQDDNGHGTHCAGLAGGVGNNSAGGAGAMHSKVKIMAIKALNRSGSGSSTAIVNGINYAVENGAKVISLSLGGRGSSSLFRTALVNAASKGVTVFAAAGNENTLISAANFFSPAGYGKDINGVMAVGAHDSSLRRSGFSNYSAEYVELGAPGSSIFSTLPNNSYGSLSGTSMATPIAAGAAGLVIGFLRGRGVDPTPALVEQLLLAGSAKEAGLVSAFKDGNRLNLKTLADSLVARYAPGQPLPAPAPAPAPSPTPPEPGSLAVTRLQLINAQTGAVIRTMTDNIVIDMAQDGRIFNMRAEGSGAIQSLRFDLKNRYARVDNFESYTLFNTGSGASFATGPIYELVVTPYALDNAQGSPGTSLTIHFSFKGSATFPSPSPVPVPPAPGPDPAPAPGGAGCGGMNSDACAVFNGINAERTAKGLAALKILTNCVNLAQSHALDMLQNNFFSHTSPTQGSFPQRVNKFGIQGAAGENIAYGQNNTSVVTAWMNSSGHRANILNSSYRSTGVGVQKDGGGRPYFVQCFSSVAGS